MPKLGILTAAVVGTAVFFSGTFQPESIVPAYRTAEVTRGPITSAVSASGKLRAVVTVEVGTQVSGMIQSLQADFNSAVKAGQVIARIDPGPFQARLNQAQADKAVAEARVQMAEASYREMQALLEGHRAARVEAEAALKRQESLLARGASAARTVESAKALYEQAVAQVEASLARLENQAAQIKLANAQVLEKTANLQHEQLDLDNTIIRSPINGVVISRNVDAGQTVAASLEAPVLFTIAHDLADMQVNISVDEADIGRIEIGQQVIFTVDSYRDRSFVGQVAQIRKAGYEISNVVTYVVVANVKNSDLSLLPGMTATARIIIDEHDDALRVPLTAFYFSPEGEAPGYGKRIWALDSVGQAIPVDVTVGITDSVDIEILAGELSEGDQVIVGVTEAPLSDLGGWFRFGF